MVLFYTVVSIGKRLRLVLSYESQTLLQATWSPVIAQASSVYSGARGGSSRYVLYFHRILLQACNQVPRKGDRVFEPFSILKRGIVDVQGGWLIKCIVLIIEIRSKSESRCWCTYKGI